jgi:hypothetical protein
VTDSFESQLTFRRKSPPSSGSNKSNNIWWNQVASHLACHLLRRWYLFFILSGVRLSPLGTETINWPIVQPQMIDDGDCGAIGGMKSGRENQSTRRKPATLPTTNPIWPNRGSNPGRRGGKPATNRLSYGMTLTLVSCLAYSTLKMEATIPPKRRLTFNGLHGVISRKIVIFITTGERTSTPIHMLLFEAGTRRWK